MEKLLLATTSYVRTKMKNGFLRVASVAPVVRVADVDFNVEQIVTAAYALDAKGVEVALFPELSVTGYTCADLFHSATLINAAARGIESIVERTIHLNITIIVGAPRQTATALRNSAFIIHGGEVKHVDKTYLPSYNEFYEKRWFAAADTGERGEIFEVAGARIGVELCEDLWSPVPPSCQLALQGAEVIFNLSASDDHIGKHSYLVSLLKQQSARCICSYVYSSAGFGESTTDLTFLPKTIVCQNGTLIAQNDYRCFDRAHTVIVDIDIDAIRRDRLHNTTFTDTAHRNGIPSTALPAGQSYDVTELPEYISVNAHPFIPATDTMIAQRCDEILTIQECGLLSRLHAIGNPKIVVGISGGLDSTLALLVATRVLRRQNRPMTDIVAVTMPGFGTTGRTYSNAMTMMESLGVTIRKIPIAQAVELHFTEIGHSPEIHDVTYENSQARYRTLLLMDIANEVGGIVLGTGDLSELALGWATYNGDHMSMYGINAGVPKTLVKFLVNHIAHQSDTPVPLSQALIDVVNTPISPELTPPDANGDIAQKTESAVGPYELTDFFLYYMLRYGYSPSKVFILARKAFGEEYSAEEILKWMRVFYRRFFSQQFKRSCMPDGPKVGSVCLSPRGDWRMPSDASSTLWLREIDQIAEVIRRQDI